MITISNYSQHTFNGWVRCSVPAKNEEEMAFSMPGDDGNNHLVVLGARSGATRSAWIRVTPEKEMAANSSLLLDTESATPVFMPKPEPWISEVQKEPLKHFAPTVNGVPLAVVGDRWLRVDGVALKGHFRGRITKTVWADLWITWVPSEPWFRFELMLNSAAPEFGHVLTEQFPGGFLLQVGGSLLGFYGGKFGRIMEGESIAQGQARTFAGIGGFRELMTEDQQKQALSMLTGSPVAVDDRLFTSLAGLGCPLPQDGFNAHRFVSEHLGDALNSMHRWGAVYGLGVSPNSGRTGAQEEQCFAAHGAEAFAGGTVGGAAAFCRYLTALTYSRRPCHWREPDGSMLSWDQEDLVFWGGWPHWHSGVSPNQLGLDRRPNSMETHGWIGPDREHWFYGSLWMAASLFGSDACQWMLEAQARIVHYQETVEPQLSTSGPDAARSVGWFGMLVAALDYCLESDDTRARVRERAEDRLKDVYIRTLKREGQWAIWDSRADPRILQGFRHNFTDILVVDPEGNETTVPGPVYALPSGAVTYQTNYEYERAWMPYQQAVGAFGLYLLSRMFGSEEGVAIAQHAADTVVQLGYQQDSQGQGGLQTWATLPLKPGTEDPIDPEDYREAMQPGTATHSWFRHTWMPLALWVRMKKTGDPDLLADQWWQLTWKEHVSGSGVMAWMPPLDRELMGEGV